MVDKLDVRGTNVSARKRNRALVLRELLRRSQVSRAQIAESTGLTNSVVSRITREMLNVGLIEERGTFRGSDRPGRSSITIELRRRGAFAFGIGIGAFDQWIRLVGARGEVLERKALPWLLEGDPLRALAHTSRVAHEMVTRCGIHQYRLLGCGVAVAGAIDVTSGTLLNDPSLGWRDVPIGAFLTRRLGMPVRVESIPNAINLSEMRVGVTKGMRDIALVTAGLGVAMSLIVGGNILRGKGNAAGQIGHMRFPGSTEICSCGQRGCLDTVASGHAILTRLGLVPRRKGATRESASDAKLLLGAINKEHAGDPSTLSIFRHAGAALGNVLDSVVATTDPETIVLVGALANANSYVEGIRAGLSPGVAERVPLTVSQMAFDEAAARLALDQFLFSDDFDFHRLQHRRRGVSVDLDVARL